MPDLQNDGSFETPRPEVITARPVSPTSGQADRPRFAMPTVSRRDARLDLALILVVALFVPIGFQLAVSLTLPDATGNRPPPALFALTKWFDALLVVTLAYYLVHRHRITPDALGMQLDQPGRQLLWSLAGLGSVYAAMVPTVMIVAALVTLVPSMTQDIAQRKEFLEMLPLNDTAVTIVLLGAVAIHEELLFRGLLIPYFRRIGMNWTAAVVVSTMIFAALHGMQGVLGVFQVFFIGLALAVVFVISRSLLAVMIAHFLFDLIQMQLVRFLLPSLDKLRLDELAQGG